MKVNCLDSLAIGRKSHKLFFLHWLILKINTKTLLLETIKPSKNSPIGIFDSGLGGLTVLKSLEKILPNESFIYFGDTAHVPYGTKSAETVVRYSQSIMDFFQKHDTKAVVIACNTASAVAFQHLKQLYDIPIFDVVTPSVEFAIHNTKNKGLKFHFLLMVQFPLQIHW